MAVAILEDFAQLRRVKTIEEAAERNSAGMKNNRVRTHLRGKLDVASDHQLRHLAAFLVEGRERIEFRIALRCGNRHRTERVDAPDRNLIEPRLEPLHLEERRMIAKLQFLKTQLHRLVGDFFARLHPSVAPVG